MEQVQVLQSQVQRQVTKIGKVQLKYKYVYKYKYWKSIVNYSSSRRYCGSSDFRVWHMARYRYPQESWGYRYRILAMCQMRKSKEPLVVHRFLTWWLIDVCGSLAILLAVHLARTTTEPLQRVSGKYRPTGSDQQEDLATLGSVQLRQTLALWTLASRLPGERPLLETNGDILWTQRNSSGVCFEIRRRTSTENW